MAGISDCMESFSRCEMLMAIRMGKTVVSAQRSISPPACDSLFWKSFIVRAYSIEKTAASQGTAYLRPAPNSKESDSPDDV